MKYLQLINPENVSLKESEQYHLHEAARAVVLDNEGKVALLYVSSENYYKLPGGGMDEGEDKIEALKRECKEEIGCEIEILNEIGYTIEFWKPYKEKQTSYCYFAKNIGEKGKTNFTESEISRGFVPVWLERKEAIKKISKSIPTSIEGEYIKERDLVFLAEWDYSF